MKTISFEKSWFPIFQRIFEISRNWGVSGGIGEMKKVLFCQKNSKSHSYLTLLIPIDPGSESIGTRRSMRTSRASAAGPPAAPLSGNVAVRADDRVGRQRIISKAWRPGETPKREPWAPFRNYSGDRKLSIPALRVM